MKSKKKVLLVDDVKLFLKLEETFFKRTGCEILTAQSGEEAIKKSREQAPDLILLDYIMPDMMGDEVIGKLKGDRETSSIPVIIVSTSSDEKDVEKCFSAGAVEYVTKPINAQELLAKAANILNIPSRVHYRIPVEIEVVGEAGGGKFRGISRNISQGGILVDMQKRLNELTMVVLHLPILEGQDSVRIHARVVRADEDKSQGNWLLGMQFIKIGPDQEKALQDFIVEHGGEQA